jgi:hypothetical protein
LIGGDIRREKGEDPIEALLRSSLIGIDLTYCGATWAAMGFELKI